MATNLIPKIAGKIAQALTVLVALLMLPSVLLLSPVSVFANGATTTAPASSWNKLTPEQKQALGPLMNDWPAMSAERQQKWLVFSTKFQKMTPVDQKRALEKMSDWVKLTPQQRLAARENYIRSNKLQPDQRAQKWQEYQQLTDEEKMQLASRPEKKKLITNLPSPAESKQQKLQPLKKPANPTPLSGIVTAPTVLSGIAPSTASASAVTPRP